MELTQSLSLASSVRLKQTNLRPFYKKGGCQRTSHSTFHSQPGWNARLQDEAKRKKSQKHQGTTFREEAKYTKMCKCPQLPWHSWRATLPNPRPRRRRQGPCSHCRGSLQSELKETELTSGVMKMNEQGEQLLPHLTSTKLP